jgi:glycosyltransferase involved in cell wall biosynthesis
MKILVLGSEIPATTSMPGSPRLFSLCRELSARHRLTLVAFSQSAERHKSFRDDPMSAGVFETIVVLPEAPAYSWWRQQVHRLRQEASFVTRTRHPAYFADQCRRIRDTCVQGNFDVIYADGLPVSQYLAFANAAPPRPAIIDLHDCFTLLLTRTMRAEPRWPRKLAMYAASRSIARLERALSRVFSRIITNSTVDEASLKALDPAANTLTIGNGVDSDFFGANDAAPDMTKLVFTGVMDYGPNADAAVYFAEDVLPLIQRRHPEVQFWIVGKDPTERVRALATRRGVHVTGGVPDVRPYLQSAGIFVCPLRFGSGVKNKLLAALAMNKAVVATRLSIEGLDLQKDQDLLLADSPVDFAAAVTRLVENAELARQLGKTGQAAVKNKYSWGHSARLLEDALHSVARG